MQDQILEMEIMLEILGYEVSSPPLTPSPFFVQEQLGLNSGPLGELQAWSLRSVQRVHTHPRCSFPSGAVFCSNAFLLFLLGSCLIPGRLFRVL